MRTALILASGILVSSAVAAPQARAATRPAGQHKKAATRPAGEGVHAFTVKDINGEHKPLVNYKGKVLLIVNVASFCGYTKQYPGLEALYQKYKDRGLVLVGFPSNEYKGQEPNSNEEIKQFCSNQKVTFPLMAKTHVKNGPDQIPVYQYLTQKEKNGRLDAKVSWNFNKFLVGRDGKVIKHYESKVAPDDEQLAKDIEAALKQRAHPGAAGSN